MKQVIFLSLFLYVAGASPGQTTGTIRGTVTLRNEDARLHNATVSVLQLRRHAESGADGVFEFRNVPPGTYDVVAHMHALTDEKKRITVKAGAISEVHFALGLASLRQELTVTASGQQETTLETFQAVTTVEGFELLTRPQAPSLGELLQNEPGIAKRSFGPGTSRPVVRGFDGDRVLVLQDGGRTGTLSSQSADHGEPVETTEIERVEVVRGPATLLYGSNAIGGVVNVITRHHELHEHPHEGFRGSATTTGGSNNGQAGLSGNFEYGFRDWLFWGAGGAMRTGDYDTPTAKIENSGTRMDRGAGGFGRYSERRSFTANYGYERGRYGVPFSAELGGHHAEEEEGHGEVPVDLAWRRHHLRLHGVLRPVSGLEQITGVVNYTDWNHNELEGDEVGTRFYNRQLTYQGMFQQRRSGSLSGSFGAWGMNRDFKALGAEALAPPVRHNAIAAFALERFDFEHFRLQFGGRIENNRYTPERLRRRSFTGFSGSAGINVPLWNGGAFVTNYTHAYRAPALEELYNNGPHLGNLAFEIGNDNLTGERGDGVEMSIRHQGSRFRAEANTFFYRFSGFVFLAPTGTIEEGLRVATFDQADTRYMGTEARVDTVLHSALTLNLGFDAVDAQIRRSRVPLPRIPPVRGRAGLDFHARSFSLRPELILSNAQWQLFPTETRTAGYAVVNLGAGYTIARQHVMHVFNVLFYNASNRLYRNHLSLIKDLAPEIGRGVRFSYTINVY